MASPNNLPHEITIEFDSATSPGYRTQHIFNNPYRARQFWTRLDKTGRNPKIIGAKSENQIKKTDAEQRQEEAEGTNTREQD